MTAREQSAYDLATVLKKARRQMMNAIRDHLAPTGACLPAIQLMKRAAAGGSLSQLELAQEIELEPAALSRLVADLEADGLVVRRRDPQDKRRLLMEATPAGLALLDRARPLVLRGVETMASRLTDDEQRELSRLLEKFSFVDEAGEHQAREHEAREHEAREHEAREHEAREHEARGPNSLVRPPARAARSKTRPAPAKARPRRKSARSASTQTTPAAAAPTSAKRKAAGNSGRKRNR